jgi:hypothetical protein
METTATNNARNTEMNATNSPVFKPVCMDLTFNCRGTGKRQTAANNEYLAVAKRDYNAKIYKRLVAIMNEHGNFGKYECFKYLKSFYKAEHHATLATQWDAAPRNREND